MDWTDVYPRPLLRRKNWQSLCGEWLVNGQMAYVPSCRTEEDLHYSRSFDFTRENDRVLLHFGAADQIAEVKLNGVELGLHSGGYLPFEFDISELVVDGVNLLEVHVSDALSHVYPYGKQRKDRGGMWYTPMSGLWQSVWIEQVPEGYIRSVKITPDLKGATVTVECPCKARISFMGQVFEPAGEIPHSEAKTPQIGDFGAEGVQTFGPEQGSKETFGPEQGSIQTFDPEPNSIQTFRLEPAEPHLWTPDDPYLYTAVISAGEDEAEIYFALRTVEIKELGGARRVCLNGEPIFLCGVLDQGYFAPGLMLPPDPDEYERDVLRAKELGFNLIRKHIKLEPEQFYYCCDRLGMLVMQDMVNTGDYSFLRDTVLPTVGLGRKDRTEKKSPAQSFFEEHSRNTVERLYSHPCIIAWTIFNEGWGQFNSDELYESFKAMDPTRLVDSTSGWFAQEKSDFDSRHIYFRTPSIKGGGEGARPLFISECGGYSLDLGGHGEEGPLNPGAPKKSYGYGKCEDGAKLTDRILAMYDKMIVPAIKTGCCGFVYTQLSDIEDEINGLYTYDRTICKADKERMREASLRMQRKLKRNI